MAGVEPRRKERKGKEVAVAAPHLLTGLLITRASPKSASLGAPSAETGVRSLGDEGGQGTRLETGSLSLCKGAGEFFLGSVPLASLTQDVVWLNVAVQDSMLV